MLRLLVHSACLVHYGRTLPFCGYCIARCLPHQSDAYTVFLWHPQPSSGISKIIRQMHTKPKDFHCMFHFVSIFSFHYSGIWPTLTQTYETHTASRSAQRWCECAARTFTLLSNIGINLAIVSTSHAECNMYSISMRSRAPMASTCSCSFSYIEHTEHTASYITCNTHSRKRKRTNYLWIEIDGRGELSIADMPSYVPANDNARALHHSPNSLT